MKPLILLLVVVNFFQAPGGSGFYGITFNNINSKPVNTDSYRGKRVIIVLMSTGSSSTSIMNYLDSVQRARPDINVLAIPTAEFGGNTDSAALVSLQNNYLLTIAHPLKVKKSNGTNQHTLFAWLTNVSKNKHFDVDADEEGKVFIVSAKGTLYGVLGKHTPASFIGKIINKDFKD